MISRPGDAQYQVTPMWWGVIVLRLLTFAFAAATVVVHRDAFAKPALAWAVLAVIAVWTAITSVAYARTRTRWKWLVVADLAVTLALMLTSRLTHSAEMLAEPAPLITTVWVTGALAACAVRFGLVGGIGAGAVLSIGTVAASGRLDLDTIRDGVLLCVAGLVVGMASSSLQRAAVLQAQALRHEAATAERERLARGIHDGVLQVLAQVRKRAAEAGGEAAELAKLAGDQEIALRALIATSPTGSRGPDTADTADLRAQLQVLATTSVAVASPADEVLLPSEVVTEVVAAVREALSNVQRHAGAGAKAWVLLEDVSDDVVISVRDDGCGIPDGRLAQAAEEGRLGVAQSLKGRIAALGGTITLDTAPGSGTEWEMRIPRRPSGTRRRGRRSLSWKR